MPVCMYMVRNHCRFVFRNYKNFWGMIWVGHLQGKSLTHCVSIAPITCQIFLVVLAYEPKHFTGISDLVEIMRRN